MAGTVKQLAGGIGYVELAYAQQNQLSTAQLRNASGNFVGPTVAGATAAATGVTTKMTDDLRVSIINASDPEAYPISGFTYLLLYQEQSDQTKAAALAEFLLWAMDEGQQYAEPMGYAPLPEGVVEINLTAIDTLTCQGKPLVAGPAG